MLWESAEDSHGAILSEGGTEGLITFETFDEFISQILLIFIMVSPADIITAVLFLVVDKDECCLAFHAYTDKLSKKHLLE